MATGTTNEFNALCNLTPSDMLRLEILALSGNSPVTNAFTEEADRMGLTPKGRERKEREEQRKFALAMESIRQQAAEFRKQLDLLEQATVEALRENEEQLLAAREELRRIRDRAYEITMPDGTIAKVYRDGDKVRTDDGTEVGRDIIRAEDLPASASDWSVRKTGDTAVEGLVAKRSELNKYHEKVLGAKALSDDDLTPGQMEALRTKMPEGVSRRYAGSAGPAQAADGPAESRREPSTLRTSVTPTRDFSAARQGLSPAPSFDQDFFILPPAASMPAPR